MRGLSIVISVLIAVASAGPAHAAGTPPSVGAPAVALHAQGTLSTTAVPLHVSWPPATPGDAPLRRYQLQRRLDGSGWRTMSLASPLALSAVVMTRPFKLVEFRLRAIAIDGLRSTWALAQQVWLSAVQEGSESVVLSSGWQLMRDRKAFGAGRAKTSTEDAAASHSFVGREIAWVTQLGRRQSVVDVYVDGSLAATVDLRRSSTSRRRVAFTAAWAEQGQHEIELRNRATPGRPNANLDAFVVLAEPRTATLVGAGDISRCDNDGDTATAAVVAVVEGTVYTTGDNVYHNGTAEEFAACYEPTWGAFKDRTRPSPGNHDYGTPGAAGYYDYFGTNAGPAGRGWYGYDAGTWRVYSLNSECTQTSECAAQQLSWLAADLAAEPHRCVIAYWHRPLFSSGPHGSSTRMAAAFQLLYDHGAELVLAGHDHTYERMAPARPDGSADAALGIRQFVIGTGGAALYGFQTVHPLSEVRDNSTHGVLRVDLSPGGYSWEFLPAGAGTFTDAGAGTCH